MRGVYGRRIRIRNVVGGDARRRAASSTITRAFRRFRLGKRRFRRNLVAYPYRMHGQRGYVRRY